MFRTFSFLAATIVFATSVNAQQPSLPTLPPYIYKTRITAGTTVGGHTFTPTTTIDNAVLNDNGDICVVAHWLEGGQRREAVFTQTRMIATDADLIDGKPITRINGAGLEINAAGHCAYEAAFGKDNQTGVFVEKKFIVALSVSGAPNDLTLSDDDRVTLYAAIPSAKQPGSISANQAAGRNAGINILRSLGGRVRAPIPLPDPSIAVSRPGQNEKMWQAKPNTAARACAVPEFPNPASWRVSGEEISGPIANHAFDEPIKPRPYDSAFLGKLASTYRSILCGADGKPLLIAIGDAAKPQYFELWSPRGLVTYTLPDGLAKLEGFTGHAFAANLIRSDTPLRISRRGQILMPVRLLEASSFAILLGTPR